MNAETIAKDGGTTGTRDNAVVQIDRETHATLRRAAQVRGVTMGELVATALREYVARNPVTVTA